MAGLRVLQPSELSVAPRRVQCPSARPEMRGSAAFGVIQGTVEQPLVGFLEQAVPVTEELLALSGPVEPTEVFRFAMATFDLGLSIFGDAFRDPGDLAGRRG